MNSINNKEQAVKPAYESMTCGVVEVETQGVLCGSAAQTDGLTITGSWMGPATDL